MKPKTLSFLGLVISCGAAFLVHALLEKQPRSAAFVLDGARAIHELMGLGTQSAKIQAAYVSSLLTGGITALLLMCTDLDVSAVKKRLENSSRAGKLWHAFWCTLMPIAPIFIDMQFTPQNRGYAIIQWAEDSPLGLVFFSSGVYVLSYSLLGIALIILTKKGILRQAPLST